ncbi:hypothetical protein SLEP1_g20243 [Rubroshorea leprosula]|uniref:Uncharacterized protein n=1 Tax=Rubroshorea leprosula TaxID=152421 RepID=A0AAV5JB20_9ROSI|nr:hypothetical protein SLEP1_g20243 [Rubroshorea leprosula]
MTSFSSAVAHKKELVEWQVNPPTGFKRQVTDNLQSGKEYIVQVCGDNSVAELRCRICKLTNVLSKRQNLLYPKIENKLSDDSILLSSIPLKPSLKMTMIGYFSSSPLPLDFICSISTNFKLISPRITG